MYRVIKSILVTFFAFTIPIVVMFASEIWIGLVVAGTQVIFIEAICWARDSIIAEMRRLHAISTKRMFYE